MCIVFALFSTPFVLIEYLVLYLIVVEIEAKSNDRHHHLAAGGSQHVGNRQSGQRTPRKGEATLSWRR